jgi:hypothetical protein
VDSDNEIKLKQYALLHGWILPRFAAEMGLPTDADTCNRIKDILKRYLRVSRTRDLSVHGMRIFIASVLMILSREFGVFIPDPQDGPDADKMTLAEYLIIKQIQYDRTHKV